MWFAIIGATALILSFLYFFRPEAIKKIDEFGRQLIVTSERLLEQRKKIALFYLIAGIALIYTAFRR